MVECRVACPVRYIQVVARLQDRIEDGGAVTLGSEHQGRHAGVIGMRGLCACGQQMPDQGFRTVRHRILERRPAEFVSGIDTGHLREHVHGRLIVPAQCPEQQLPGQLLIAVGGMRRRQRQGVRCHQARGDWVPFPRRPSEP